ncbi:bZIP transcription factor 17-like [Olea europaea var. sylvestris]|uniref:BZIP transcription factor 17-like n=1 Tax=Olea europaea subsp. europaea TaxID=158383 RepID=A0A8S0QMI0_OLEEU|nr:bZIP transcription factor 17-like [Olea europaea var. sylvestris]CAA2969251.1 bZIP transcription factor 17-like [Olea europaea subsp. europaea]
MADPTVVADPPTPPLSVTAANDFDSGLSMPPPDPSFFSEHLTSPYNNNDNNRNDDDVLDLDFNFSFDDLYVPSSDLDDLLMDPVPDPIQVQPDSFNSQLGSGPDLEYPYRVFKSTSVELRHLCHEIPGDFSGDQSLKGSGVSNSELLVSESAQISGYLNVLSPESNGSNRGSSENSGGDEKALNCLSPESQVSENCGSNVSVESNNCAQSVNVSPNFDDSSIRTGVVDQKIKLEKSDYIDVSNSALKRKKESEDSTNTNSESRINKYGKSSNSVENNNSNGCEEDEKRKARLMRNRESAQLSRQRKKHHVEELEDKVRAMHSTIQDLNTKISYFMAENATLRQQLGAGNGTAVPPPMAPPPSGVYPHPAMMYPWMQHPPPYVVKPQGSQVPLVPIPRLKPQQHVISPNPSKKVDSKKKDGVKTKKVAGVSFLGLLFFIMLFGGLVPMVNVRYGGMRESFMSGETYVNGAFYGKHHGRVLMVNGSEYGEKFGDGRDFSCTKNCGWRGHGGGGPSADEFARVGNGNDPLAASLYVPRNDKLVKIDGNLIIHSVLASEKAMASRKDDGDKAGVETGLAVPRDLAPAIPVPGVGKNGGRHPHLRALDSGSADRDLKSKAADGKLQQWFREGLAGPMLSSGMCTEVFQFDVSSASASGALVRATMRNITAEAEKVQNSTYLRKGRNRRILHGLPIPLRGTSRNISKEHEGRNTQKEKLNRNNSISSMVVSVLFDPREVGDVEGDSMMRPKPSRFFVVVLIDSVKYVTYSCMLPFKGSGTHLVST